MKQFSFLTTLISNKVLLGGNNYLSLPMKKILSYILFVSAILLAMQAPAQNTLDKAGLTSSTPAKAAYSLRLLSSSYTGPLVRIAIGIKYYDVYPDASANGIFSANSPISAFYDTYNASLTGATSQKLSSIIGSNSATVAIWYDQSGNGLNVSQATTANQPKIINAGVINTSNSLPSMLFNGINSTATYLYDSAIGYAANTAHTINSVAAASTGVAIALSTVQATNNNSVLGAGDPYQGAGDIWFGGWGQDGNNWTSGTSTTALSVRSKKYTPTANSVNGYYNGTAVALNSGINYNLTGNDLLIGMQDFQPYADLNGTLSEVFVFTSVVSDASRAALESNQGSYYGITVTTTNSTLKPINGNNYVCVGGSTQLSDSTALGVWSSGNTSVATVNSNGLVTGVSNGTAAISYTIGTGSSASATTIFITVSSPTILTCEAELAGTGFVSLPNCLYNVCAGQNLSLSVNPNGLSGGPATWTGPNGFSAPSLNSGNDISISTSISASQAGVYTATYSYNGCVSTVGITVNVLPVSTVGAITGTANVCAGSTTQLSDTTANGVWSSSNNAIATVNSSGLVTGVAGGTTTISYTVTNANGCVSVATILVTVSTPVVLTCEGTIGSQYSISGLSNCSINACLGQNLWLSVNPNNLPGGSATWTGPNGYSSASINSGNDINVSTSLTAAQAGVYTATYTYGVCTSTVSINVIGNPSPVVAPITGNTNTCIGATTQLIDTTVGGVWKSGTPSYASITNNGLVTGITAGNIYVYYTVTNTNGCSTTQQFLVSINSPFVFTCEGSIDNHNYQTLSNCTMTVCQGSPLWLSVNPNFTNPPGAVWTGPNGFNSPSINSNNDVLISSAITPTQAGVYTATYTGNCVSTGTITVVVNPLPVIDTIIGVTTICPGSNVQFSNAISGGVWKTSNTYYGTISSGGLFTAIANGNPTLTYTVTNTAGCSASTTKSLTILSGPVMGSITGANSLCNGGTITLKATSGTGIWASTNNAITTVNSAGVVTGISGGTDSISYTLTSPNGCSGIIYKTMTDASTSSLTTANICSGSSYTFNGKTYNTSGTYSAHFTNAAGCDSTANLVLTVYTPTVLDTITGISSICVGSTIQLSNSNAGGSWASSNNYIGPVSSGGLFTANAPGSATITYTYTNPGGCISTKTKLITVNNVPYTGPLLGSSTVCTGNNDTLVAAGTGVWTTSNPAIATNVNGIITGVKAGIDTVIYTLTNSYGCTTVTTAAITVLNNPINLDTIVGNSIVCVGSTIQLTNSTPGGTWSSFDHYVATISNSGLVTGNAYGNSTITYYVSNANGCHNSITKIISTVNVPYTGPIIGSNIVCTNNNDTLRAAGAGTWSVTNSAIASINNGILTGLTSGTDTVIYVLTNSYGCVTTTTSPVTVLSNPILLDTIVGASNVCVGSNVQLTNAITGGVWSSSSTYAATITQTGLVTGNNYGNTTIGYYVSNANGCYAKTTKVITTQNLPYAGTISGANTLCNGNTITLKPSVSGGSWTSTNNNITTVNSSGIVTGVSGGTDSIVYKITNTYGCVSTLYKSIIDASTNSITNASICSNNSYTFNGTSYSTSGTYTYHTTNAAGCDSAATLVLTVKATSSSTTNLSICPSSLPYSWNGLTFNAAGTLTAHLANAAGCDSAATLVLTVKATSSSTTNLSICPSALPYTWNGLTFNAAGTQTVHLTNAAGCDSAATLVLTVKAISSSITNLSICPSSLPYSWNGLTFNAAGTQTAHLANAAGCDSAATLVLTVKASSTSTTYASICSGSNYTFNGTAYNTAGTYTYHTLNAVGCDSVATLALTIRAASSSTTNLSICPSALPYSWNGLTIVAAGTKTVHLTNAVGCDSAATLVLTVKTSSSSTTNASICSGASYIFNGTSYSAGGTYTYHTTNAVGCDSTATLNLTINNPSTSTTTITSCNAYTWNGTTYTTSGAYTYNTTNAAGCDSIATLILTINNGSTSTTNATICAGSSYTFNGQVYNAAGTYLAFLTNNAGCDSVATLNLIVNQPTSSTTYASICNGSAYSFNGQNYNTTGTYLSFLTNSVGCDSVATLVLTVNMPTTSTTNVTACSTYTWNATTYTNSGTYTYNTTNSKGCDSIATLNLIISNGTSSTTNISICNGSSYSFNGQTYNLTGTYLAFLTNSAGCDSVATLNLKVNQPTTSVTNITNCNSFTWNGTVYTTSGTYTFHTNNAVGCDSIATLNLIINKGTSSTTNVSICNGSSYIFNGHTYNSQGTYTATLTNNVGCDSTATLNLTVTNVGQPTVQPISGISSVCPGDSTILTDLTPGGIWSIDSNSIATIDSITGLVKGLVQGAAIVSYTVGSVGSDCSATVSVPLTINCNEVASGSTGGLESKGLGNAVAKRVYNAALSNTDNRIDYSRLTPVKTNNIIQVMGTTTPGTLTLSDLMPAKESIGCGYKSYDMSSHVTDLTGFTNAEAVQTFDYVAKNETQSVTFLTRTYGNIYAHTKPVCDRLKEAKLLDVKQVVVQGMSFIQYKLQQNDGKIEYAISFSAGVKQNDSKFTIQSIWLTKNYAIQDTMYNFQVWAVEPAMAKNMVNNILTKLNGILPVNQTVNSIGIPTTYITDITRTQNKLILNVRNNTNATNGAINLTVRSNENMTTTSPMSVPVTLLPNAITPVSIDVNDSYESDISLLVDNNVKDMVYMNDGNWNYSVSKTSIVPNKFSISNDGIMPTADEYRLFRNVTIDINVPDYVSIYKMMKAGGLSRDVSKYNQLQFKASALNTGKLIIVIQKAAITNWSEQYTYTLSINGDLKDYAVNLKDFRSTSSNDTLKANDIVTITFSFIGSGNNNHIIASLADVKFSQKTITQPVVIAKTMNVFPNPATDKFSVRFESPINTQLKLQLVEMGTGRIILNKEVNVVAGENLIPISINTNINTDGHYVLLLGNETIKYSPFKLVLRK